jgi:hypothetical protein
MMDEPMASSNVSDDLNDLDTGMPPLKKAKYEEEDELKTNVWNSGCSVCDKKDSKYRCPGCEVITCSLNCTKQHRANTGCKGTRNRSAYVPISQFNEAHLMNDINLLNDFSRANEISRRRTHEVEQERLPKRMKILQTKTRQVGLKLHFLPSIMSKHRINSTRFDNRLQKLFWHVELHFDLLNEGQEVSASGLDDSLDIATAIRDIMAHSSKKTIQDKVLQTYPADTSQWRYFLLQTMCPANQPLYHSMFPTNPIRQTLLQTDILEFPTIHITTSDKEAEYELFTKEKYESRSKSHLEKIDTLALRESSSESDEEEEEEEEDGENEDSSDSESDSSEISKSESNSLSVSDASSPPVVET